MSDLQLKSNQIEKYSNFTHNYFYKFNQYPMHNIKFVGVLNIKDTMKVIEIFGIFLQYFTFSWAKNYIYHTNSSSLAYPRKNQKYSKFTNIVTTTKTYNKYYLKPFLNFLLKISKFLFYTNWTFMFKVLQKLKVSKRRNKGHWKCLEFNL